MLKLWAAGIYVTAMYRVQYYITEFDEWYGMTPDIHGSSTGGRSDPWHI